jgi:hypothetical protein
MTKNQNTTALAMLMNSILIFLVTMGVCLAHKADTVEQAHNRYMVEQQIAQEKKEVQAARAAHTKALAEKATKGCSRKPKLTNRVIAIGASNTSGPYFNDQVYVLTFDEAWKAGKSGSAWLVAWC